MIRRKPVSTLSFHRRGWKLLWSATVLLIAGCLLPPKTAHAQTIFQKDSIADYEIPYIVGEAREMTLRLMSDLNSLHANIPEDTKSTIFDYVYEAFEEGENARVHSDLKYKRPAYSLRRANPISISKYALDFELDPEINQIVVPVDSFQFTFPEFTGSNQYEMYGAFHKYFLNVEGDTLNDEPMIRLAGYVASRDTVTGRFNIKLQTITFLDKTRLPDFMLPEELAGMAQQYFEWKKSGSSLDSLQMMSDEALKETLREAREKRASKEKVVAGILIAYQHARARHDIVGAAGYFAKAEQLQRNNPILLSDKTDVSEKLAAKIEENYDRSSDALNAGNYEEASRLSTENDDDMGIWSQLNSRKYDNFQKIKQLESEIAEAKKAWDESQRKIENPVFRDDYMNDLLRAVGTSTCETSGKSEGLAEKFYFLGQIGILQNTTESAVDYFHKAVDCKSEFAAPKLALIKWGDKSRVAGYLDDLIYFEPKNPQYYLRRGLYRMHRNETQKAQEDFAKALTYDPNNAEALMRLAQTQIKNDNYEPALTNLDNLLYIDSLPEAAVFATYAALESEENARDAMRYVAVYASPEIDKRAKQTLDSLVTIYRRKAEEARNVKMKDYEAAEYFEKMFVLAGHFPEYYPDWGAAAQCYFDMGNENDNYERALLFADSSIAQSNNGSNNGFMVKGKIERINKNYEASKKSFYDLLQIRDDAIANYELGETYFQEGREIVSARVYFENALKRLGKSKSNTLRFNAHKRRGQCYRIEEKYKLSEDQLKEAIKVFKKIGEGYYQMGLTYLANPKKSKTKKAFKYFDKALSKGYDDYTILSATARAHYKLEDYKKAEKAYQQLHQLYEKSISNEDLLIEAKNFIALDELKKATANLKQIVSRNNAFSGSFRYNYLQGIIHLKKARGTGMSPGVVTQTLKDAEGYFQVARSVEIANPSNYLGMSIAQFYLDRRAEAMQNLSKALNLGVDVEPFDDDKKFKKYFKSKPIKKEIKAHK